jgi:hypothetical protein
VKNPHKIEPSLTFRPQKSLQAWFWVSFVFLSPLPPPQPVGSSVL